MRYMDRRDRERWIKTMVEIQDHYDEVRPHGEPPSPAVKKDTP